MKPIFKNPVHQSTFEKDGFLILPGLSSDHVKELSDYFYKTHSLDSSKGFVSDSYALDYAQKKSSSEFIVSVIKDVFENVFVDFTIFGGSYLYKMPDMNSELSAHQDWTIVDESKFQALNCWIPLVNTDISNGTLQVVPGTHFSNYKTLRAPTLPFFFNNAFHIVNKYLTPLVVSSGSMVILDQSLIHYSGVNYSSSIRPALTVGVKSHDAPMQFCFQQDGILKTYSMHEEFLISFEDFESNIYKEPKGTLINEMEYKPPILSQFEVSEVLSKCSGKRKIGLIETLFDILKSKF